MAGNDDGFDLEGYFNTQSNLKEFQGKKEEEQVDVVDEMLMQEDFILTQVEKRDSDSPVIEDGEIAEMFTEAEKIAALPDYGQNSTAWKDCMEDFSSAPIYDKAVKQMLLWVHQHPVAAEQLHEGVVRYIKYLHFEDVNEDGKPNNCASSIRSKISAFNKFFLFVHKVELKTLAPELEDCVGKWEKKQAPQTQAKTMTESQLVRLYELPDTCEIIPKKAFVGCSTAFAGRGIEAHKMGYTSVKPLRNDDGKVEQISVAYERRKQNGIPVVLETYITGDLEISAVMGMYDAHTTKSKEGNFFAYIDSKTGKVKNVANPNIGHNSLSDCGKFFAALLGLDDPHRYTGHWCRRTALSLGADRGMSAAQLMGLGGHKSMKSVMTYIDRAPVTLRQQGNTMAVGKKRSLPSATDDVPEVKKVTYEGSPVIQNHFHIGTVQSFKM